MKNSINNETSALELLYVYIHKHEHNFIANTGINLTLSFNIKFDNKKLIINKISHPLISLYTPFKSIAALIGENGTGKTSAITCICKALIESPVYNFDEVTFIFFDHHLNIIYCVGKKMEIISLDSIQTNFQDHVFSPRFIDEYKILYFSSSYETDKLDFFTSEFEWGNFNISNSYRVANPNKNVDEFKRQIDFIGNKKIALDQIFDFPLYVSLYFPLPNFSKIKTINFTSSKRILELIKEKRKQFQKKRTFFSKQSTLGKNRKSLGLQIKVHELEKTKKNFRDKAWSKKEYSKWGQEYLNEDFIYHDGKLSNEELIRYFIEKQFREGDQDSFCSYYSQLIKINAIIENFNDIENEDVRFVLVDMIVNGRLVKESSDQLLREIRLNLDISLSNALPIYFQNISNAFLESDGPFVKFAKKWKLDKSKGSALKIRLKSLDKQPTVEMIEDIYKLSNLHKFGFHFKWEGISSGQLAKLNFYSQVHERLQSHDKSKLLVMILDEPEVYLHPEWQRRFLYEMQLFIKSLYPKKTLPFIQMILLTHSPIAISDLPTDVVNVFGKHKRLNPLNNTFGDNIHTNFYNAFLTTSTKGEIFNNFFRKTLDKLKKSSVVDKEYLVKQINQIGDPLIRNILMNNVEQANKT